MARPTTRWSTAPSSARRGPGVPNSFLVTEKTYGDFILEFDVRQDVGPTNSGVQFRSLSTPEFENGRVHGYQADIDPSPRQWSGDIYEEAQRGWFYTGEMNPPSKSLYKFGEWNHYRIEAIGPRLRVWINDGAGGRRHRRRDQRPVSSACRCIRSTSAEEAGRTTTWKNLVVQTRHLKPHADDGHLHPQQPAQQPGSGREGAGLAPAVGRQDRARVGAAPRAAGFPARAGRWRTASSRCCPRAAAATS